MAARHRVMARAFFLLGAPMTMQTVRRATLVLFAATLLAIAGCRKVSGTYEASQDGQTVSVNFKSADKVEFTSKMGSMNMSFETTYTVEGDKVKIHPPAGAAGRASNEDIVFTVQSDGSLKPAQGGPSLVKK